MSNADLIQAPSPPSDDAEPIELPPPNLKTARLGMIGEIWRLKRHHKKRRRMASKGKVQWYLIDDSFPTPKFIKPKMEGGGIPKYEHKGTTYLFPKEAMMPSQQQGIWTVVHRVGEADPVNLRDPSRHSIRSDVLDEYLTLQVVSDAPSLLDRLDFDAKDLIKWGLVAIVFIAMFQGLMGGGL